MELGFWGLGHGAWGTELGARSLGYSACGFGMGLGGWDLKREARSLGHGGRDMELEAWGTNGACGLGPELGKRSLGFGGSGREA